MVDDWPKIQDSVNSHSQIHSIFLPFFLVLETFVYRQGSFDDEEKDIVTLPTDDAYRMAMKSMLRWVKKNMDPNKTRVFFTSMSPSHEK